MSQTAQVDTVPADSIRVALEEAFAGREYDWAVRRDPFAFLAEIFEMLRHWLAGFEGAHPVAYWLLVAVLAVSLLAILAHFVFLAWRALRPRVPADRASAVAVGRPRDAAWYLSEARRLRSEGRYTEALASRFVALVLDLDRRRALSFHPCKTPAEYQREARLDPDGARAFGLLVRTLYRHLFGGASCGAEDFDGFDRTAGELGGHVAAS